MMFAASGKQLLADDCKASVLAECAQPSAGNCMGSFICTSSATVAQHATTLQTCQLQLAARQHNNNTYPINYM